MSGVHAEALLRIRLEEALKGFSLTLTWSETEEDVDCGFEWGEPMQIAG